MREGQHEGRMWIFCRSPGLVILTGSQTAYKLNRISRALQAKTGIK